MFDFLFDNKQLVGIDVSNFSLKLLELKKVKKKIIIEHAGIIGLNEGAVVNSKITKPDEVTEKLEELVRRTKTLTKKAVFAISGSDAISKIAQFPVGSSDDEILDLIQSYPDQYIPYPIEEMALDYRVLGVNENDQSLINVIITGAKYADVSTITDVASNAGLIPKIIDVNTYTLENIFPIMSNNFPDYGKNKSIAIVDIGAINTNMCVFENMVLSFARVANFGGKRLTDDIMAKYGVSYSDAGRLKKEGGLPDNYEVELLSPFKEDLVNQISRLIRFYTTSNNTETIDYISLGGGCSGIEGLADFVESKLNISCGISDPFSQLSCSPSVSRKFVRANSASLLVAGSLAMRAFDQK